MPSLMEQGRAPRLVYVSGLPKGKPRDKCRVYYEYADSTFLVRQDHTWGAWEARIPFSSIIGLSVETLEKHVSAGRVLTTGALGLVFKKQEYGIAIDYALPGALSATAVLGGPQKVVEQVRQQLASHAMGATNDAVQPANGAASSSDALYALADLHDRGVLTDAEFDEKKAELLKRL